MEIRGRYVVVGSGRSLLGKNLGPIIDAHEHVVRVNHAVIDGFEEDVGTRRDILFLGHPCVFDKLRKAGVGEEVRKHQEIWLYQYDTNLSHVPGLDDVTKARIALAKEEGAMIKDLAMGNPTSGFVAIWKALAEGPPVSICGFGDPRQTNGMRKTYGRYYEKHESLMGASHNLGAEDLMILQWVQQGFLTPLDWP